MSSKYLSAYVKVVRLQLVVGVVISAIVAPFFGFVFAGSFLYGALLMGVNSWLMSRRMQAVQGALLSADQRVLYVGAAVRFMLLIVALFVAHLLGMFLLLVALGMFAAQAVLFFIMWMNFRKEGKGEGLG